MHFMHPLEPRRLFSAADLDLAFAAKGLAVADVGPQATSRAAAVQADGKILVAGSQGSNALLVRFHADGSIDPAFATNGVAKLNLGANESFSHLAVLPDGKILAAGNIVGGSTVRGFIARYRSDGALDTDTRFGGGGGDGIALLGAAEAIHAFAVSDTKIFTAAGEILRRHNLGSGSLDSGYHNGGQQTVSGIGGLDQLIPHDLAVSPDGARVAIAGYGESSDPTEKKLPQRVGEARPAGGAIVMLEADTGSPDSAFDGNGVAFYEGVDVPRIAFAPTGGTLLVAASFLEYSFESGTCLFRFQPDGTYAFTPAPAAGPASHLRVLADGDIVIAGQGSATRFNADGSLDMTYSADGTARRPQVPITHPEEANLYGPELDGIAAVVLADGRVVLAQYFSRRPTAKRPDGSVGPLALSRLLAAPPAAATDVHLDPDGTLIVHATDGDDIGHVSIEGDYQRAEVYVNDDIFHFPIADVQSLSVLLGDGNDSFGVDLYLVTTPVNAFIDAGAGDDRITSAGGNDTLLGDVGNDEIFAGAGDDRVFGNGGKDTLYGSDGRDRIAGGRSNDVIRGGDQADTLIGGDGGDELFGDGSNDHLYAAGDGIGDFLFGGGGDADSARADEDDELTSVEVQLP